MVFRIFAVLLVLFAALVAARSSSWFLRAAIFLVGLLSVGATVIGVFLSLMAG